jgi:hypothetical protein
LICCRRGSRCALEGHQTPDKVRRRGTGHALTQPFHGDAPSALQSITGFLLWKSADSTRVTGARGGQRVSRGPPRRIETGPQVLSACVPSLSPHPSDSVRSFYFSSGGRAFSAGPRRRRSMPPACDCEVVHPGISPTQRPTPELIGQAHRARSGRGLTGPARIEWAHRPAASLSSSSPVRQLVSHAGRRLVPTGPRANSGSFPTQDSSIASIARAFVSSINRLSRSR